MIKFKMNKKGFTMVELMVSISMIAIIMVFLIKMLVDIKNDSTNELYNTRDQVNRAEIIKTIENSLMDKTITSISSSGSPVDTPNNSTALTIQISTAEGYTSKIILEANDDLTYIQTNSSGTAVVKKQWEMTAKKFNSETHYQKTNIEVDVIRGTSVNANQSDCVVIIEIPVIVDWFAYKENADGSVVGRKNSRMDDIILTFYSNSSNNTGLIPTTLNPK